MGGPSVHGEGAGFVLFFGSKTGTLSIASLHG
jgi:hypothetical protein